MKIKLEIELEKLIVITENHGGYLVGQCIVCGESGWLGGKLGYRAGAKQVPGNHLKHKHSCPVNEVIVS